MTFFEGNIQIFSIFSAIYLFIINEFWAMLTSHSVVELVIKLID